MSGFNPFRPRNLESNSTASSASTSQSNYVSELPATQVPNGLPRKSSLSLEVDDSTSSDEQNEDPFNPDSSVSDNDNDDDIQRSHKQSTSWVADQREPVGSAPHPAPSTDGSPSPTVPFTSADHTLQSGTQPFSEETSRTSPPSRVGRERKPPPPPQSHHGKRINSTASAASSSSQTSNRRSLHPSSPESLSSRTPTAAHSSSAFQAADYFAVPSESQSVTDSPVSLQRSHSQHKRPPTPPLSRRQSQMRRSKSTQSKSSVSRLTMSSGDSESNTSSRPPSPGPSSSKRISMPPPASGDFHTAVPSVGVAPDSSIPPQSRPSSLQPGRRASSHGSLPTGSAPPPPPPRRVRDAGTRSSDGGPSQRATEADPLPQPSNAHDILADLSRLQKEVDDLRGQYENRKISQ
ncbi:hypothetical protein NUU61_000405 [Penicillium alfredii]|uniref:Uncharacterized protein n=1 Tax=Penicillium alfredii TaxID=1506179 RepID=A0A9W9KQZ7_9EURO|nr:uncharacterized protein NUU61_000405 [Penicillium alfredii]KAJ5114646.1 hypothetical protein NUU61_000405 [Penicillium alfredii]